MEKQPDSNCRGMEKPKYKAGSRDVASLRSICLYFMAKLVRPIWGEKSCEPPCEILEQDYLQAGW